MASQAQRRYYDATHVDDDELRPFDCPRAYGFGVGGLWFEGAETSSAYWLPGTTCGRWNCSVCRLYLSRVFSERVDLEARLIGVGLFAVDIAEDELATTTRRIKRRGGLYSSVPVEGSRRLVFSTVEPADDAVRIPEAEQVAYLRAAARRHTTDGRRISSSRVEVPQHERTEDEPEARRSWISDPREASPTREKLVFVGTPKVECPECGKNVAYGRKVGQGNRFDPTHGLRAYAVVKLKKHAGCDQATAIKF
jgi:hypothetical protein